MAGTSLAADLGLADHGYSPIELERPYGWMGADGETLILHRDLQRTLAEIRHFSPRDARKYAEIAPVVDWLVGLQVELGAQHPAEIRKIDLLRVAGQVGLDRTRRSFLAKMLTMSIFELVSETFESDAMRVCAPTGAACSGPRTSTAAGCTSWASLAGGMASVARAAGAEVPHGPRRRAHPGRGGPGVRRAPRGRHRAPRAPRCPRGVRPAAHPGDDARRRRARSAHRGAGLDEAGERRRRGAVQDRRRARRARLVPGGPGRA